MNFPERFRTGVRDTTIPNPAVLEAMNPTAETYQGFCSGYNFKKQTENFNCLREVLLAYGTDFLYVASAHYRGDLHTNHRFVACSVDGSLLWNKYVAFVAQGGQNHVYVGGMRVKVSVFLALPQEQQFALLSGSKSSIEKAFAVGRKPMPYRLESVNEDKQLWN